MAENDVAAPAATTEAPAPETVVEAPKPTGVTGGSVKQSGRANAHALGEKYQAALEQAKARHHSQDQPRTEAGQFDGPPAAPVAGSPEVLGGSATAEATASTPAVQGPPDGMVRIELGQGHPLADQGETYIDVPKEQERKWRTAVNAAARRVEVEQAARDAQEARAAQRRAEAALQFYQENGNTFWTQADQALYDDIVASYGPSIGLEAAKARAEAFKRGREAEAKAQMGEVAQQADMQSVAAHWQTEGQTFRSEALRALPEQYPGLASHEVEQAITMYALELQRVQEQAWSQAQHQMTRAEFERRFAQTFRYSEKDFMAVAGDYLKTRPGVLAATGQAKAAQELRERQIRAEAEAAERDRRIEAGQRHATNPQRALGGISSGQRTTDTSPQPVDRTAMTSEQIRRAGQDRARAAGERLDRALGR